MNLALVRFLDRRFGIPLCRLLAWGLRIRHLPSKGQDPKRILIVRGFGVGNLVLMLPALEALRGRYPDARIDAVTLGSNRGFLERVSCLSRIWYLQDKSVLSFCVSLVAALVPMLSTGYDLYVDFDQFARTPAILGLLLLIPRRVGFATPGTGREPAFTDPVPYRQHLHMMDGFYTLLEPLGIAPVTDLAPVPVPTTAEEEQHVETALGEADIRSGDRIAIVHPGSGANFPLRRWPADRFARVADYLAQRGFRVVLSGARSEADIVARVQRRMTEPAFNAVGRFSLGQLIALLGRAALVISNDTGPIHLAAAQGTPVIGLYGPNTPVLYGPRGPYGLSFYLGLPCSPCMSNVNEKNSNCRDNICMTLMTVEQVVASLSRIFEGVACAPTAAGGVRDIPGALPVHPLLVLRKAAMAHPVEAARA
jgi:ADP-heptose:LPS heptosyltransferase